MGFQRATTHCSSICWKRNTLPSPFDTAFFKGELDKSHSFFCDILLRLFWSQPSMAFLQRAGATSFSFLRVIQGTQQTLWSTAQWPRKKTRHTMSFTHTHIQRHAHYASPPIGHVLHSTSTQKKNKFKFYKSPLKFNFWYSFMFLQSNYISSILQVDSLSLLYHQRFIIMTDWLVILWLCPARIAK